MVAIDRRIAIGKLVFVVVFAALTRILLLYHNSSVQNIRLGWELLLQWKDFMDVVGAIGEWYVLT